MKLAVITTHPVQYNAPLFELITARGIVEIKVFYTWGDTVLKDKYDPGFNRVIQWDIPLLDGYAYEFLLNTADDKGSHHFKGIINPDIIERINLFQPDALLVYGWSFSSHMKVLRHFKNKCLVMFRGDSTLLDKSGWLQALKRKFFLHWVYRNVDIALYAGKSNYKYFLHAGLKNEQLYFAPHAVHNERFACSEESCKMQAKAFRRNAGIPEDAFVFLFAGKLENKKDPALLLQAFTDAGFKENVFLVMLGNGMMETALKNSYRSIDSIIFIDFLNQQSMPAAYEAVDVFVLPSRGPGETWGLSVNEAMANGMPVIVSDRCGCAADLVDEGLNGYVFPSGDVKSLTLLLKSMYNGRENIPQMQKHALEKISGYSFTKVAASIEDIMQNKLLIECCS